MSCNCGGGEHKHDDGDIERDSFGAPLYGYIDHSGVQCLNESIPGTGRSVIKPWDKRLTREPEVQSDDDPELIFVIPFSVTVKLKAICLGVNSDGSSPALIRIFNNRSDIDFSNVVEAKADQILEIGRDSGHSHGVVEYPVLAPKFQNASTLTLHIARNHGASSTRLSFLGFKGDATMARRGIVETTYEASAQVKDHVKGETMAQGRTLT